MIHIGIKKILSTYTVCKPYLDLSFERKESFLILKYLFLMLSRFQMSRCLFYPAAYCKCLENMIKELTRPLLILVFTQCVMVKGSKGIQAWQYPLLITLQLHRARTASYDFRKSYFDLFEKENIKNTKSKILCSISNSIKLSFSLRWFWNILHFSVL